MTPRRAETGTRTSIARLAFVIAGICAAAVPGQAQELPRVLFYADPQGSDNDIVRRARSDEPSVAERQFVELAQGVFRVTATQDAGEVTRERLRNYDAVVFFTAMEPPADAEALVEWVRAGGAFTGIHSTANTFRGSVPFGAMLGARFDARPWRTRDRPLAKARVVVVDREHTATAHLRESFEIEDDLYVFRDVDQERIHVLLRMDPASLDMSRVARLDRDLPIAWTKPEGEGRVFYTALGDAEHVWRDPRYRTHLLEGVRWTLGPRR